MSEKKLIEKTIDGETYLIGLFPATEGYEIQELLFEMLLPSVAALLPDLEDFAGKDLDKISNSEVLELLGSINVQQAVMMLVQSVQAKSMTALLKELLKVVTVNGVKVVDVFDLHFAKRYKAGIKLGIQVCNHNGFFDLIVDLVKDLQKKNQVKSNTPTKSPKAAISK